MATKATNLSASTPLRNGSPLVRRSMTITPISNAAERLTVDARQERLSSINTSATTSNTSTVVRQRLEATNVLHGRREDFMSYIKLFQTNKITKQNIWDVNLIHDFYCLVDMRDETVVGDLHLASVALDASAKIYSMRVDDVHQEVTRLASGLMRSDIKGPNTKETVDDENNDEVEVDASGETGTHKKKKVTRPRKRKPRSHIVTDVSQINGEVEVNTELDKLFTSRAAMLGDAMTTDKMFSLTLDSCKGVYITDVFDKKIMNCDEQADIKKQEKEFPIDNILKWCGSEINPSLSDFKFLDWDCEDITVCENEDVGLNSSQLEIAFDINAPVDQIPDDLNNDDIAFDNNFDDNFPNSDEENENAFSEAGLRQAGRGLNGAKLKNRVEYTYDPRIKRIISKLYAGPLHYKFPFQRKKVNVRSLYNDGGTKTNSGEMCRVRNAKKVPHQELKNVDNSNEVLFKSTKTNKLKGSVMLTWNSAKNILPDDLQLNFVEQNISFLRKATNFNEEVREDWPNATSVDDAVPDYDYQNVNDSNFCAVVDNAELYSDDDNAGPTDSHNTLLSTQELVDAPELVNKVKINYDTKVRTVDMKVVKQFTWKFIREQLIAPPEGVQKKSFIMFSSVFAELHKGLPRSETENLTLGIASLSVMHITNDNNLVLEQGDNDDFKISPFPE